MRQRTTRKSVDGTTGARHAPDRGLGRPSPACEFLEARTLLSTAAPAEITVPDSFGYRAVTHPYSSDTLAAGGDGVFTFEHLSQTDDASQQLLLPEGKSINFYGTSYDRLWVSSNGLITFGGGNNAYANTDLEQSSVTQPAIAPLWDDWITQHEFQDRVLGRFDGGRLIIEWSYVYHYFRSPSAATFQAIIGLNPVPINSPDVGRTRPSDIVFNYVDLDTGDVTNSQAASATVGIKSSGYSPTSWVLVSRDARSDYVGDGKAVRLLYNRPPELEPLESVEVQEGSTVTLTATAVDSDPGDVLVYDWDLNDDGLFDDGRGPSVSFSAAGRDGPDEVQPVAVRVTDGHTHWVEVVGSAVVTVTNGPPAVRDDAYTGDEDGRIEGSVLENDEDPSNTGGVLRDVVTAALSAGSGPSHGSLDFRQDGTFVYTPDPDFFGVDSFEYVASDGEAYGVAAPARVTLTVRPVNDDPVAVDDFAATSQDQAVSIDVTDNDTDVDVGDRMTAEPASQPSFGTVDPLPDGTLRYLPRTGFVGTDSFTYRVTDAAGASAVATVAVRVAPAAAGSVYLIDDATRPGKSALVVNGTDGDDRIQLAPADGAVHVYFSGVWKGAFSPTGRIVIFGYAGNDWIHLAGAVTNHAWLYGDDGSDSLNVGNGGGVVFGGGGNDQILGGSGRDVMIGGDGGDRVIGNAGDDIIVSAVTDYDDRFSAASHEQAWGHIYGEWASARAVADRIASLRDGADGGTNGRFRLNHDTVHDDADSDVIDMLTGASGEDWFIYQQDEDRTTN